MYEKNVLYLTLLEYCKRQKFTSMQLFKDYNPIKLLIIMEEKPLTNAEIQKITSRRSRKDEEGRDFQCGCGKRYLSYPALYTHIKTKHEGVQPQGTLKTGINAIRKNKGKPEDQTFKHIELNIVDLQDIMILKELDESYLGHVPFPVRMKKESVPREILECYSNIMKHPQIDLVKTSSIDQVLTIYLLNLAEFIHEKLYDYYLIFAKLARNCYQEHGEEIHRRCFSNREGKAQSVEGFVQMQVKYFPIICDFLTRHYIPYSDSAKEHRDINISLIQLMLYDFCRWLLKKRLTIVKVELKKDYKLDAKPFLLKPKPISHPSKENSIDKQDDSESQQKKEHDDSPSGSNDMEEEPNEQVLPKVEIERNIEIINNSQYLPQMEEQVAKSQAL